MSRALNWEDFRDAHNHLRLAAESAFHAMMLVMEDKPARHHQALMYSCLEKAADRMGYNIVPRVQEARS